MAAGRDLPSNSSATSPPCKIAALSSASNDVNNTHVYYQDESGEVMEGVTSGIKTAWRINKTGIGGKNGSAVAAAVSRPGFPLVDSSFLRRFTFR